MRKKENNGSTVYHTHSLQYELKYEKMLRPDIKGTNKKLGLSQQDGSLDQGDDCQIKLNPQYPCGAKRGQISTIVL